MKIIEPESRFSLYSDFTLSATDNEVLSLLYLPLIKAQGLALYQAFHAMSLMPNGYWEQELFLGRLGLGEAEMLAARERLEATGLLESYRKESKETGELPVSYLYRLIPPATPKKFFNDVLLRTALSSAISQKEIIRLKSYFKVNDSKVGNDYRNVSVPFKDVFSLEISQDDAVTLADEGKDTIEKNYKSQSVFSFDDMTAMLLSDKLLVPAIYEEKERITSTAVLYGLKEREAADFIENNITSDGHFVMDGFLKDVRTAKKYSTIHKEADKDDYEGRSSSSQYLKIFASLTPRDYLALKLGSEPPQFMMDEISKIHRETSLNDAVINVALDYSLRKLDGEFNAMYIEKVCYSLASNNISNASDAMVSLNKRDFKRTKAKTAKTRRHVKAPQVNESENTTDTAENDMAGISGEDIAKEFGL